MPETLSETIEPTRDDGRDPLEDLVKSLLRFGKDQFTGTLRTHGAPEGFELYLCFQDGNLVDVIPTCAPSLLERALLSEEGSLTERDKKKIFKQSQQTQTDAGRLVLDQGLLPAEEISSLVLTTVEAEIGNLLAMPGIQLETVDRRSATIPVHGVAEHLQLSIHPEHAIIGAARRLGLWEHVKSHIPTLKDVYYATPTAFALLQSPDDFPLEVGIVEVLDGRRDLLEVIATSGFDPFECLHGIHALHHGGNVALINPVQLFQLGCEYEREGNIEKALRLFERAEERGLDDFDLGYKLGEIYHALGRTPEAIERFLAFAEKCVVQFRIEDTIRSCRKIIEIDPDNLPIQERYISLLARYGKGDEAVAEGMNLARRFREEGDPSRARSTLEKIIELAEANEEVLRLYSELCQETGHEEGANSARKRLASLFHQREETEKALELYQGLFVNGEDTSEVRARLVELHYRAGNQEKSSEHLKALRGRRGWNPEDACPEAVQLYRNLYELEASDPAITRWLVKEAHRRGDREESARLLRRYRDQLETTGELEDALRSAERLHRVDPENVEDARALASLEHRCGLSHRGALVLEELAGRLANSPEHQETVAEILRELLEMAPLSLRGRQLLLAHGDPTEKPDEHQRLLLESALLELVSGNIDTAHELMENFAGLIAPAEGQEVPAQPLTPFFAYLCGRETAWRGDPDKAREWYYRGARLAHEDEDRGLLRGFIGEIEAIDPEDPQLETFREALQPVPVAASEVESPPQRSEPTLGRAQPKVIQSSVSNITARLRSLHDDGGSAAARPTPTGIKGNLDKLKNLKGGGEPAPSGATPAPAAAGADDSLPPPPKPKTSSLSGIAKLKALKDGAATTEVPAQPPPESATSEASEHPAPPENVQLGSSISKLKGLKGGDPADAGSDAPKVNNPTPKKTKKLGSAASKLSSLRDQSSG